MYIFNSWSSAACELPPEHGSYSHFHKDHNLQPWANTAVEDSFMLWESRDFKAWVLINERFFVFSFTMIYSFLALGFKFISLTYTKIKTVNSSFQLAVSQLSCWLLFFHALLLVLLRATQHWFRPFYSCFQNMR